MRKADEIMVFQRDFLEANFADGHQFEARRKAFMASLATADLNDAIYEALGKRGNWEILDGIVSEIMFEAGYSAEGEEDEEG